MSARRVVVRRASAEDAPALARIHLDARRAAGSALPPPVHADEEYLPHLVEDVLPSADVRLGEIEGRPAGLLVLDGDLLADLYVAPALQGRGVGTALLEEAKTLRPEGLRLWVFASNTPAQRFYSRNGFAVVGGTDGDNEEGAPDLLMRWQP